MPNNQDYCNTIRSGLARLAVEAQLGGASNLHDLNIHAESFYRQFLNLLYGWDLRSANLEIPNAKGIDLYYSGEKIVVQVSSTYTKKKIQDSLDKSQQYQGCHFYFVPVSQKEHEYREFTTYGLRFNPETDILSHDMLNRVVNDCDIYKQQKLSLLVDAFFQPIDRRAQLHLKPLGVGEARSSFEYNYRADGAEIVPLTGRDRELDALLDFVKGNDKALFRWWAVAGPGGAGKSKLALTLQTRLLEEGDWAVFALNGATFRAENGHLQLLDLSACYPGKTLFLVDYVQQHLEELCQWLKQLSAEASDRRLPLRLLLLERDQRDENGALPWFDRLKRTSYGHGDRVSEFCHAADPLLLNPFPKDAAGPQPLLTVIRRFADYVFDVGSAKGEQPLYPLAEGEEQAVLDRLDRVDPELRRPLIAMMLAHVWVHRQQHDVQELRDLLRHMVQREEDFLCDRINKYHSDDDSNLPDACFQLWRAATVLGVGGETLPASQLRELLPKVWAVVEQFAAKHDELLLGRCDTLAEALLSDAGIWSDSRLLPLRPDILGEAFVLDGLEQMKLRQATDFFRAILSDLPAATEFFLRVLRDLPGQVRAEGGGYRDWLVPAAMPLEEKAASALVRLLSTLFRGAPPKDAAPGAQGSGRYVAAPDLAARTWLRDRMAGYVEMLNGENRDSAIACSDLALVCRCAESTVMY